MNYRLVRASETPSQNNDDERKIVKLIHKLHTESQFQQAPMIPIHILAIKLH